MKPKRSTSYRLSADARRFVAQLSDKLAINQTAVLELAIRLLAKQEQIEGA